MVVWKDVWRGLTCVIEPTHRDHSEQADATEEAAQNANRSERSVFRNLTRILVSDGDLDPRHNVAPRQKFEQAFVYLFHVSNIHVKFDDFGFYLLKIRCLLCDNNLSV